MPAPLSAAQIETLLPLARDRRWKELSDRAAGLGGDTPDALYLQAMAAFALNDLAKAASLAEQALDGGGEFIECADLVAICHCLAGDVTTALYYGKYASAVTSRPDLQPFRCEQLPDLATALKLVQEKPLLLNAKAALGLGRVDTASDLLRQHLYFFRGDEEAMLLNGVCLALGQEPFATADWFRGCIHRCPSSAQLVSALALELADCGQFAEARAAHERAMRLAPTDPQIHARLLTDLMDDPTNSVETIAAQAKAWGKRFQVEDRGDRYEGSGPGTPLTVAIILTDLPGTPAGTFFADLLSRARPKEIRLVGYGYGELTDADKMDFQKALHHWYDLTDLDAETVADMFLSEDLDVILDTGGFASPFTLAALGSRVARRQVLWHHAPYGAGLPGIDAILSDAVLDAGEGNAALPAPIRRVPLKYGASLAGLPSAELPLAEFHQGDCLVFGADVTLRHLTAETAAWWAEVLLCHRDWILLLRNHGYRQGQALNRLTSLFGNFGLTHRIEVVTEQDDAAFWSQVDVALQPVHGAHPQQTINILWNGLPAITPIPPGRHRREAASLLHHAGLADLTAGTIADFARIAVDWAKDDERRRAFRGSIRQRLSDSAVFNPDSRADDLWLALKGLFL